MRTLLTRRRVRARYLVSALSAKAAVPPSLSKRGLVAARGRGVPQSGRKSPSQVTSGDLLSLATHTETLSSVYDINYLCTSPLLASLLTCPPMHFLQAVYASPAITIREIPETFHLAGSGLYDHVFVDGDEICLATCWFEPWDSQCYKWETYMGAKYCKGLNCNHDEGNRVNSGARFAALTEHCRSD